MKKSLALLYIICIIVLGVAIPNMIANGYDIPIGVISVVGISLIILPFFIFSSKDSGK